jgi:ABC-2 type transport system permease protein
LLIYFFIFLYGAQVMRGVIEEKTSRIVEVIISSVKPFELMMGKIIGIALVGLTQFLLWMVLTFSMVGLAGKVMAEKNYNPEQLEQSFQSSGAGMPGGMGQPFGGATVKPPSTADAFAGLSESINLPLMLGCFLFYFLGGYLLYGALFAAIGSAVDSEADTQQFMLPITIPMILAITMSQVILTNPESSMAFWFSIIPLTSPIIMMVRLPFGVPTFDLVLSMVLLIVSFIGATWISGKIYRTGILMYGKKNSYKELWKWLFYKG